MKKPSTAVMKLPVGRRAEIALKIAVAKAIDENARLGIPNYVWRDGKVVALSLGKILENRRRMAQLDA